MAALISLNPGDPTPIYAQIERGIRAAVATGRLSPGDQLPTVRQLAVDLRVNANTVARVYLELERAGLVETRRGVGTFVTAKSPEPTRPRRGDLRTLVTHLVAEAAARGFTVDELVQQLEALRGQTTKP